MISINNLQKKFGEKLAVNIDHYEINQGDMLGLVGNNGAGKTTLFRLMLDLLKADNGNVVINEIDVSQSEDWKNFTGAFIDDGFLIDYLTGRVFLFYRENVRTEKRRGGRTPSAVRTSDERRSDRTKETDP